MISMFLAGFAFSGQSGIIDHARLDLISQRMSDLVVNKKIAGAVTLVAVNGKVVELSSSGYRDLDRRVPMTGDTIFQVMSMTKPVTAAAVLMLVEDGSITLRTPISQILPEFADLKWNGKAVHPTVEQLLCHVAGFSSDNPGGMSDEERSRTALAEFCQAIAKEPLVSKPGEQYRYSGIGFAVLGRIVEVVSKMPLEQFFQTRIFRPLRMSDTTLFLPPSKRSRLALTYSWSNGMLSVSSTDPARPGSVFAGPAGGLYSTARDMLKFFQCLANGGELGGTRILSEASVEEMKMVHTGDLSIGAPGKGYGFGLIIANGPEGTVRLNSIGTFGHPGALGTEAWIDPSKRLVGIYMAQITGSEEAKEVFMEMANSAVGK